MNFEHSQKDYWQRQGQRRNPQHPAVEGFARPKVEVIKKWLTSADEVSVLEVGAGNGYLTHYLGTLGKVVAVDFSFPMLRENHCEARTVADGARLPFPDRTFDVVIEANLLHHVPQPRNVVLEMRRVSKRIVVLIEPNRWNPLMLALGLAKAEERRTLSMCTSYLRQIFNETDCELVEIVAKGFVTPNRMPLWLAKMLNRLERPSRFAAYLVAVGCRTG